MSRGILDKADRALDRASSFFALLSGILVLLMAFTATYGVARRYLFQSPEPYSYELSTMFLVWTFVLALASLERLDVQLRVDFLVVLFPKKFRIFVLNVVSPLLGLLFCSVLTRGGWTAAIYSLEIGEKSMSIWAVPLFPVKIVIPVGYGLLCIVLLLKTIRGLLMLRDK